MQGAVPGSQLDLEQVESAALLFLVDRLPAEDLTAAAIAGELPTAVIDEPPAERDGGASAHGLFEWLTRALYRRSNRHVLLTGLKGVGKTTVVRELARRAARGEIPFLADRRFLWIDAKNVGPEDSRGCLETILRVAAEQPSTVLCLDGLDALLKRPQGGTNKPLLRAAAARPGLSIIGILSRWEFNDLIAGDAEMLELFTRIEVEEPHEEAAVAIARQNARRLEREYGLPIAESAINRAVVLASNYILNASHPAKAIRILEQCCDEKHYEITQVAGSSPAAVTADDVVRVVAGLTGIPAETLAGETGEADFVGALSAQVVGQPGPVRAVATELQLIKAGLNEPGKPASVLLLAGMTGVGKTELAKRLAELYSTSKQLNTYSMGNFTEPHTVSGIIGVPPGYVGHEQGGRLINELNADPYAVFLLDEAEKAHPNVWKPFLNLFDEGWIEDQRGVRAYADRAIFILTTNAGERQIEQMTRSGKPEEEITERVKTILSKVKQERSSQPVFTPQFLARLRRVIVFGPLDEQAMIGISRVKLTQMQRLWQQKREKSIEVPESLITHIGRRAHELNEQAQGKEGGRIVRKLITDLVEIRIQQAATQQSADYKKCSRVELGFVEPAADGDSAATEIEVRFCL
jgi:ATP-dependent Clp protease ATP-binding subunit ClpA